MPNFEWLLHQVGSNINLHWHSYQTFSGWIIELKKEKDWCYLINCIYWSHIDYYWLVSHNNWFIYEHVDLSSIYIVYVHGRDKNSRLYLDIIKYDPNIMYQQRWANNSNMKWFGGFQSPSNEGKKIQNPL